MESSKMIDLAVILVIKDKYDINDKFINTVLIERFFDTLCMHCNLSRFLHCLNHPLNTYFGACVVLPSLNPIHHI